MTILLHMNLSDFNTRYMYNVDKELLLMFFNYWNDIYSF